MTTTDAPFIPVVRELGAGHSPEQAFLRLSSQPYCMFLDSSLRDEQLGRYSFLMADPFDVVRVGNSRSGSGTNGSRRAGAIEALRSRLDALRSTEMPELPPFQGGAAGVFGYEFGQQFESLPLALHDEFRLPQAVLGFYDVVLAFDHRRNQSWLISQGFPETDGDKRQRRAERRCAQFATWLESSTSPSRSTVNESRDAPIAITAAQRLVRPGLGIFSNFTPDGYRRAVDRAIEYIRAGDIFQVNLAQRLIKEAVEEPVRLYLKLRRRTPATFAGFFDVGNYQVISASPERFVRSRAGHVEARPIKGTRPQKQWPEADLFAGDELLASEKDRAENTMIVDLLRNDVSRACQSESVQVAKLCGLETYGYVQHLVSVVTGQLRDDRDPLDLLPAAFPGGSITGAPKVHAMEIITELEQVARGPYCGSLGYIGWQGSMDLNILIRTITAAGGWWQMPVGGGVVVQSNAAAEYEETWDKAQGVLAAMG